jgi:hypothetical protein
MDCLKMSHQSLIIKRFMLIGSAVLFASLGSNAFAQASAKKLKAGAVAAAPAAANTDLSSRSLYQEFNTALARGDYSKAADVSLEAWRDGERLFGRNSPFAASLAFNAAWTLGLANRFAEAREPAQRAVSLSRNSDGLVDPLEATFILAYANLSLVPDRTNLDRFNEAARNIESRAQKDSVLERSFSDAAKVALSLGLPSLAEELILRGTQASQRRAATAQSN